MHLRTTQDVDNSLRRHNAFVACCATLLLLLGYLLWPLSNLPQFHSIQIRVELGRGIGDQCPFSFGERACTDPQNLVV
jgi:hypothetical protein